MRELMWRASALDDADADAPPDADAIASLQRALERYLHALRPRLFDPPHRAAARPPPPLEVPGPWPEDVGDELGSILACVWARDRIVVQRRRELVWIYPDGEAEQLRFEGAVIGWIDPRLGVCVAATGDGLGVYDLGEDRWLDRFPDRAPRWLFWEDSGRAYLRDGHGRVHPLLEVEGEAAVLETTPDARRLWVEDDAGAGGIFDTETGALVGAPPRPTEWLIDQVPMLTSSGALLRPPTFAADESADVADRWDAAIESLHTAREPASALVVTPRDRCWFLRAGVLLRGDRPHAQIGWPYQAAAFDREGERLALVDDARVIIVDPESITIERRVALPPARFRDP
ncbi:MAG: hypothetical protein H6713_24420 [Myxococcales bacterium]|nr:hypothetical protein [Myxococcales bacterium]